MKTDSEGGVMVQAARGRYGEQIMSLDRQVAGWVEDVLNLGVPSEGDRALWLLESFEAIETEVR